MIHPSKQPPPAALEPDGAPATYDGTLSRSLGVGGNVLITLSGISPASSVFILGGAALAAYGTGVFWGFAIAGVISLLIAYCYAELASRILAAPAKGERDPIQLRIAALLEPVDDFV